MNFTTDLAETDLPPRYDPHDIFDPIVEFLEGQGHRGVGFDEHIDFVVSLEPSDHKTNFPSVPRFIIRFVNGEPREYAEVIPGRDLRGGLAQGSWPNEMLKALMSFIWRLEGEVERPTLDEGSALLEPITGAEHAGIERILSILGEARDTQKLTRWQEDQIILMADLIRAARDEAVPDETERWPVVGVVGGALRYLARELPEDIVKWGAAGLVLSNIDWHTLAQALPG